MAKFVLKNTLRNFKAKTLLRNLITQIVQGVPISNPRAVFIGGVDGFWLDPSDLDSLWVDQARTQHPTAPGDVVWWIDDKSPNLNHFGAVSSAARGRLYRWPASAVLEGHPRNRFLNSSKPFGGAPWSYSNGGGVVEDSSSPLSRGLYYTTGSVNNAGLTQNNILPETDGKYYLIRWNMKAGVDFATLGASNIRFGDDLNSDAGLRWRGNLSTSTFDWFGSPHKVHSTGRIDLGDGWYEFWLIVQNNADVSKRWWPRIPSTAPAADFLYLGDISCEAIDSPSYVDNPYQRVGSGIWDVTEEGQADCWGIRGDGISTQYLSSRGLPLFVDGFGALCVGITKIGVDGVAAGAVITNQATSTTANGSVILAHTGGTSLLGRYRSIGGNSDAITGNIYPSPFSAVLDQQIDSASRQNTFRVNSDVPITSSAGTGGSMNNAAWSIGMYRGGTSPFNGLIWGIVVVNYRPDSDLWQDSVKEWLSNGNMGGVMTSPWGNPVPKALPDSSLDRVPAGFTSTGLSKITRGVYAGYWLVGDDGRLVEGDGSPYDPQVHLIDPTFDNIIETFPMPYTGASVQGLAVDTSGASDTFWAACAGDETIRHFDLDGNEIIEDRYAWVHGGQPTGVAYDPTNDCLWATVGNSDQARLISCNPETAPRLIRTITLGNSTPDGLWYDDDEGLLYYTRGSNGNPGHVRVCDVNTEADRTAYGTLAYAEAIEGLHIDKVAKVLTIVNDGGYHAVAQPPENLVITYDIKI